MLEPAEGEETIIGCDKCPSWFHSCCTALTEDQVGVLNDKTCELMWFCAACKSDSANSSSTNMISQQAAGNVDIHNKLDAS